MQKFIMLATTAMLLAWAAGAQSQAGGTAAPQTPQNMPIQGQSSAPQAANPQRGEDVGQQEKGVPVEGHSQSNEQGNTLAADTTFLATLSRPVDTKKAKEGDQVTARIGQDVLAQGETIIPRGSRLFGHVTVAKPRSKGENQSELGIAWDRVTLKDGRELPLHAVLQAVAPPVHLVPMPAPIAGGAQQGGMAGTMGNPGTSPGDVSASPRAGAPGAETGSQPGDEMGQLGSISNPAGTGANPTVNRSGPVLMSRNSGVQGMPGVTLISEGTRGSLLTDTQGNLKLETGTQIVLRVTNQ